MNRIINGQRYKMHEPQIVPGCSCHASTPDLECPYLQPEEKENVEAETATLTERVDN
jgi:hypothetical protein